MRKIPGPKAVTQAFDSTGDVRSRRDGRGSQDEAEEEVKAGVERYKPFSDSPCHLNKVSVQWKKHRWQTYHRGIGPSLNVLHSYNMILTTKTGVKASFSWRGGYKIHSRDVEGDLLSCGCVDSLIRNRGNLFLHH